MKTMNQAPVIQVFWTRKELAGVLKVSGKTIDRLVALGQFPAPMHIGRSCRWRTMDVVTYISDPAR